MRIKVMKFGGTSVATPEARNSAALRVISAKEQGFSPVVVVSAIGRRGAPYATDTLINALAEVDPPTAPRPRELDLLMSCGEVLSAVLFAHLLKSLGHPSSAMTGVQAGIHTDGNYGNARVTQVEPAGILRFLGQGDIPVVCGFQGVCASPEGWLSEITTLGRGGSDTTGSALGAALGAEAVEVFTDVDGVKSADPDFVPHAPTLRTVTYDEVAEIAHLGAKVLHPRAAEIAMNNGIPLWVKNTFSDDPGTRIVPRSDYPGKRVTGVTHTGKLVYLQFNFESSEASHVRELQSVVYEMLERYGINLFMINVSPTGLGFGVPRSQYEVVMDLMDGLVLPLDGGRPVIYLFQIGPATKEVETQERLLRPLGEQRRIVAEVTEGCTMVSVIGHEVLQQPGIFLRTLRTLHEAKVPVLQTSDSDLSVSCLVPEADMERAVRTLHDAFAGAVAP
ncbi:MAG: aspartokinase [Chthonomonas sp.]